MSISPRFNNIDIDIFIKKIKETIYTTVAPLEVEAYITEEPVTFKDRLSGEKKILVPGQVPAGLGQLPHWLSKNDQSNRKDWESMEQILDKSVWGDLFGCAWMKFTGTVPSEAAGRKVSLMIDVSGEGLAVDADGNPMLGISTYSAHGDMGISFPVKRLIPFTDCAAGGEKIEQWVDCGMNDFLGKLIDAGMLKKAEIVTIDDFAREFYYDLCFLQRLRENADDGSFKRQVERALLEITEDFILADAFDKAYLHSFIKKHRGKLKKFLNMENGDESFKITAIGHAHIDLAWLWPIRETKRKGARTFATALAMMDRYPEYIFGASQPQLYQWVKEEYPALYERIKPKVEEGRWETQGAMWVESDTNVAGGEALVRQVLYGKKFFKEEFDREAKMLWLPDVFGYSAALPQILAKSDVPYFLTIKLSWSHENKFPHHTFRWQGIDGSEVLAHMPPEGDYNSDAEPFHLMRAERNFLDRDVSDEAMVLFGTGDGGGGPSPHHLEHITRGKNIPEIPITNQGYAQDFFDRINLKRDKYAAWRGELYLECHQGTYTSQANNKKYNRLLELALRDCEFACSFAAMNTGFDYPAEKIEEIWKEVLLYQFHDILPGSSINRVYEECVPRYKAMLDEVDAMTAAAIAAVASAGKTVVLNTANTAQGGVAAYSIGEYTAECDSVKADAKKLENDKLAVSFGNDGSVSSIFDKAQGRELLNTNLHAGLVVFEDIGNCWDIHLTYAEKPEQIPTLVSSELNGDKIIFNYGYNLSIIKQTVSLIDNKLKFDTYVDWQETQKMLRAKYPIESTAYEAACGIQFGYLKRPTHQNTSWDAAKFEVCAQKWVDISEDGAGVAIIDNCKYGHRVFDNILDLTLLRSSMNPGVDADKGEHEFSYELFIHDGDLMKVTDEAYRFNSRLPKAVGTGTGSGQPFITVSAPSVIIESVKRAEDGRGFVVRAYEAVGKRVKDCDIKIAGISKATLCNLIERDTEEIEVKDNTVTLGFTPFEIKSFRIEK